MIGSLDVTFLCHRVSFAVTIVTFLIALKWFQVRLGTVDGYLKQQVCCRGTLVHKGTGEVEERD